MECIGRFSWGGQTLHLALSDSHVRITQFPEEEKNRRRYEYIDHDENSYLLDNLTGDVYFDGDEAEIAFQKAILELPDKQRLVFNLRYYDEMPYEKMAEITGTSEGALKASYHHAVKKLERFLSPDD